MVIYENSEKCVFYVLFFLEKCVKAAWIFQEKCVCFILQFHSDFFCHMCFKQKLLKQITPRPSRGAILLFIIEKLIIVNRLTVSYQFL